MTNQRPDHIPSTYTSPMIADDDFAALLDQLANLESIPLDALDQIRDCIAKNFPSYDLDNDDNECDNEL